MTVEECLSVFVFIYLILFVNIFVPWCQGCLILSSFTLLSWLSFLFCYQVFCEGRLSQLHRSGEGIVVLEAVFNRKENTRIVKTLAFKSWTFITQKSAFQPQRTTYVRLFWSRAGHIVWHHMSIEMNIKQMRCGFFVFLSAQNINCRLKKLFK